MLKKRHSAVTASAITLLPRASCLQDGTEESPADSGRNAIIVEPPFFDGGEGSVLLLQGSFARHGKWFRGLDDLLQHLFSTSHLPFR
jgi:hypothetical protein